MASVLSLVASAALLVAAGSLDVGDSCLASSELLSPNKSQAKPLRLPTFQLLSSAFNRTKGEHPCRGLTLEAVRESASKALGQKQLYFDNLRALVPTDLTRVTFNRPTVKLSTTATNVLFFGDSIVREMYQRFDVLVDAKSTSCVYSKFSHAEHETVGIEKTRREIMKQHSMRPFDLAFVGGLGIHHLFRNNPCMQGVDVFGIHEKLSKGYFCMYREISASLGVPIVFVGMMPVDGMTVMMKPPKEDWADFSDFSIPVLWDSLEARVFAEGKYGPGVFHFRPSFLAARCPGIRCDGLHFDSDFRNLFGCRSVAAVWDLPLSSFLVKFFSGKLPAKRAGT